MKAKLKKIILKALIFQLSTLPRTKLGAMEVIFRIRSTPTSQVRKKSKIEFSHGQIKNTKLRIEVKLFS
jgi:hypothetical protein